MSCHELSNDFNTEATEETHSREDAGPDRILACGDGGDLQFGGQSGKMGGQFRAFNHQPAQMKLRRQP
jgi:hypothetical protein